MTDDNLINQIDEEVSLEQLDENEHKDDLLQTPALHDQNAASGHQPDLESDDDIDEMGEDLGVTYDENEELSIDSKVPVITESEPPTEDTPY